MTECKEMAEKNTVENTGDFCVLNSADAYRFLYLGGSWNFIITSLFIKYWLWITLDQKSYQWEKERSQFHGPIHLKGRKQDEKDDGVKVNEWEEKWQWKEEENQSSLTELESGRAEGELGNWTTPTPERRMGKWDKLVMRSRRAKVTMTGCWFSCKCHKRHCLWVTVAMTIVRSHRLLIMQRTWQKSAGTETH